MTRIAIIGAGITGLACARHLAQAGVDPVVFDKGRGIGGRVATRRAGELRFDHGAPYLSATARGFGDTLRDLARAGHVGAWTDDTGKARTVGTPGMSAIPKALGQGLDVRLGTQICAVVPDGAGWLLRHAEGEHAATHVVVTVPAPQVAGILGPDHTLLNAVSGVRMDPCLTLMAAVQGAGPAIGEPAADAPLAKVIQDNDKPDRPQTGVTTWVAHAGPAFTQENLDRTLPEIADRMVPLLCDHLGVPPAEVTHAAAHRWRYARVSQPLGRPFAHTAEATLYLGGDWCVGPNIEDAFASGTAIATELLERFA